MQKEHGRNSCIAYFQHYPFTPSLAPSSLAILRLELSALRHQNLDLLLLMCTYQLAVTLVIAIV